MTTFTSPPDKFGLTLNNGDTLNVGQGGMAAGTFVLPGGELDVEGGTAVDTFLAGGTVSVRSGTLNGVEFTDEPSSGDTNSALFIGANPSSLQGTLTFDIPNSEYTIEIFFANTITSVQNMADAHEFKVNFGDGSSETYSYAVQ